MTTQIIIPLSGLKFGSHTYHFQIDKKFFDEFSNVSEYSGEFNIKVALEKSESLVHVFFEIKGGLELICCRCNEIIEDLMGLKGNHIFKYGNTNISFEDDGISIIPFELHELDLSRLIYETIVLSIPLRPLHSKGKCDKQAIEILENLLVRKNEQEEIDPRWSVLKSLNKLK